jgi:hypothetical protein
VFLQSSYPILRIFGEDAYESGWLEDPDDMYERFLPRRAEVRDLCFLDCLGPSLGSVFFKSAYLRRFLEPLLDVMFFLRVLSKEVM